MQPAASLAPLPDVCPCHYHGCSVQPADALAVHPHYTFAKKQIDSILIYMSVLTFCHWDGVETDHEIGTGFDHKY